MHSSPAFMSRMMIRKYEETFVPEDTGTFSKNRCQFRLETLRVRVLYLALAARGIRRREIKYLIQPLIEKVGKL